MDYRNLDYSSSEGESAHSVKAAENQRRNGLLRTTSPGEGSADQHDEAEELMLSEFLVSLQHIADVPSIHDATASSHGGSGVPSQHAAPALAPATARPAPARRTVVHRRKRRDDLAGPCNHCGALSSPQWRKGPKGKPVLCNACGIRFLRNRTLTKVMPKKRRAGTAAAGGKRSRAAVVAAADEDEDDDEEQGEVLMEDTMTATRDVDAAYSAAAAVGYAMPHQLHHQQQLLLQHNMLAATESALFCGPTTHEAAAGGAHARQQQQTGSSPFAAHAAHTMIAAADYETVPAAVGASTESLLGCSSTGSRGSARSLLAHLGDCPSLSLALVLHQHQQQRRQQEGQETHDEQQQQHSSYQLPKCPELQLFPPHSPAGGSSGTGFAWSPARSAAMPSAEASGFPAATLATSSSPHSTTSSLKYQPCHGTTAAPPLSPLFLEPGSAAPAATAAAATTAEAKSADILQLVQQLGSALGGIGPAVELLRFCSGNPTALSAAVAAMTALLRTETAQ